MLVYDKRVNLMTALIYRGSALESIWPFLLVNTAVAVVITASIKGMGLGFFADHTLSVTPFQLIGVALSIFLGFRNNACYDRFWEGRRLWGSVVNITRTLTRQAITLVGPEGDEDPEVVAFRRRLVYHLMAWVHALRHHLRDEAPWESLSRFLPAAEVEALRGERNVPVALLQRMGEDLSGAWRRGWIHPLHVVTLESQLTALTDVQGACERIRSTPIPLSYTLLTHRVVTLYTFTLPLALAPSIGWATPAATALVAYAFFGLDAIGSQIEEPFGTEPNDLPLTALATAIEGTLRQRLGETDLPPLLTPVDHVLT